MATPEQALRWVREAVALRVTSDRVVRVRGDDARTWLNGQLSNDLRELTGDRALYATTLTVKGRVVSDLWALEDPPGMALVLPAARAEQALARFEQHIIMEDVELVPEPELLVVTAQGPKARELLEGSSFERRYACPRLDEAGVDVWLPDASEELARLSTRAAELGGGSLDDDAWAALHLALGVPRIGVDFGDDTYPQEAGIGKRALSFGKGCYLGQEVVYMLENRGQVARRLVQLELPDGVPGVSAGAELSDADGKRVGSITSFGAGPSASQLALAFVKRSYAEPEQKLWLAGSPVRVRTVIGS
jgi:folate-binding protein YgfZ